MKKLGYVLRRFPVVSETFILYELLELEKLGHSITIYSLLRPKETLVHDALKNLKAEVIYLPKMIAPTFFALKKWLGQIGSGSWKSFRKIQQAALIARHAQKENIEHLHAHFANQPASLAKLAASMITLPFSFTAHAYDIFKEEVCKTSLKEKIEKAAFVVTISDYNTNYLKRIAPTGRFVKILNGIDTDKFMPVEHRKKRAFTFCCAARLVEKKGHLELIEACYLLKERGKSFFCTLAGDGPLRKEILEKIAAYNLEEFVALKGALPHDKILELMQSSDAFVLPCKMGKDGNRDGLSVSIVEALMSGLPVITTPMTANPEVIIHEKNGLFVPFEDSKNLADAMERLIADRPFFSTLRQECRPSVVDAFDRQKTTKLLSCTFNGEQL